ncbi:MAG: hypothetical protein N0A24_09730 [Armatimonadetes bacterium]|nr:hypothetical protein [Armatimonadota bacterium]MDW8154458.1 hypothetical protein [Armatimonadota bacterium]
MEPCSRGSRRSGPGARGPAAGGMTQDGGVWSNFFHPRVVDITVGDVVE